MNHLFVYGTLLQLENAFGLYLRNNSKFIEEGRFKGKLYDIGEYPGAVYEADAGSYVFGSVLSLNNPDALVVIDDYEGFGSNHPVPNEFVRKIIQVECKTRLVECWVYLYNLPVGGLLPIKGGNYITFVSKGA